MLIGDVNGHVITMIKGNHDKTSPGGKLLVDLLDGGKYVLVNALDITAGGPFTRYDCNEPDNDDKKSTINLVVVSTALVPYIQKLEIDNKLNWTPYRVKENKLNYPDHYALKLTFYNIPIRNQSYALSKKFLIWNTKNKNVWEKYAAMTNLDNKELT